MTRMIDSLQAFARDTRGATAIEYGLIVSLVVLALIVSLESFAATAVQMWNDIATAIAG